MGCDRLKPSQQQTQLRFNPRTRMGCDKERKGYKTFRWCFNPRTRMGCDQTAERWTCCQTVFQSTHPHGVRRGQVAPQRADRRFNPRTRMGCDAVYSRPALFADSFNPRTRMGCDSRHGSGHRPAGCFNPRTRMGCDMISLFRATSYAMFQSTHPHGVRRNSVP